VKPQSTLDVVIYEGPFAPELSRWLGWALVPIIPLVTWLFFQDRLPEDPVRSVGSSE
jgi:hypothetical protein